MLRVEYAFYYLPQRKGAGPRAKPYKSAWKMSPADAAARGAVGMVPGTAEMCDMPETDAERLRALWQYQSAGRDGARPPPKD